MAAKKKSSKKKKVTKKASTKKKVTAKKATKKKTVAKKKTKAAKKTSTSARKVAKKVTKKASTKKKVTAKKVTKKKVAAKKTVAKKAVTKKAKVSKAKAKKSTVPVDKKTPASKIAIKEIDKAKIAEELSKSVKEKTTDDIILTDAEGRTLCRYPNCDQVAVVEGYCRYHYLLHWKKIQLRRKILSEGKLVHYVIELTARYPDKFVELLVKDLGTDKDFQQTCAELGILSSEESGDLDGYEGENESF